MHLFEKNLECSMEHFPVCLCHLFLSNIICLSSKKSQSRNWNKDSGFYWDTFEHIYFALQAWEWTFDTGEKMNMSILASWVNIG